ncbi:MAG: sulfite exporter TauE/SafE family protein [Actinomycetes bacterium]
MQTTVDLGLFSIDLGLVIAGVIGGFVVGLTGMGGGALMTPLLILFFGVDPVTAVSSDLVVSLCMKPVGASVHLRRGTVNLQLVKWLVIGSVPAAVAGVLIITSVGDSETVGNFIKIALGVALLLSVTTMVGKALVSLRQHYREQAAGIVGETGDSIFGITVKPIPTLLIGVIGGVVVGMTSVGSGSLIIVGLLLLYPRLRAGGLVGTDLVQAVPLVGAAALTYIVLGEFHAEVALPLILGALPGVFVGARVSSRGQAGIIRRALVVVLFASGLKLVGLPPIGVGVAVLALIVIGPLAWAVVRSTSGFEHAPQRDPNVSWWRLVWASASGVPPRYQGESITDEPKSEWGREKSAADPL